MVISWKLKKTKHMSTKNIQIPILLMTHNFFLMIEHSDPYLTNETTSIYA